MIDVAAGYKIYYYHYDGLGSVVALSDVNSDVVELYEYDVFGQPTIWEMSTLDIVGQSTVGNPYMFTGRRLDAETGLYYYRFRYYDPYTGRFLQTDPIRYWDSMNLYQYCFNDPISFIDPYGLFRFGKRPLNGGNAPCYGTGPPSDLANVETVHEHGFFEDGSGENVGFRPDGRYWNEDPEGRNYRYGRKHYDDDIMREALKNLKDGKYRKLGNNCQDWCSKLRREYRRLKKEKEKEAEEEETEKTDKEKKDS